MRRILFPLLIIGVTAGLFSLGSGAFFSDVETSISNDFDAGTLDLTPNNNAVAICEITNFAPDVTPDTSPDPDNDVTFDTGGSGVVTDAGGNHCEMTVTNVGTLAGDLYLAIDFPTADDLDNTCTEPEGLAENAGTCDPDGELDDELDVSICTTTVTNGTEDTDDPCSDQGKLAALAFSCTKVADLSATNGAYAFVFDMDSDAVTNISQDDSISINITWYLQQDGAPVPSHTPEGGSAAPCGS